MRMFVVWVASTFLAGCETETSRASDAVTDANTALRIGQQACAPEDTTSIGKKWNATLHGNVWRVWLDTPDAGRRGPAYETHIRASNGEVDGCQIRAIAR
jgi:hypothetical protein